MTSTSVITITGVRARQIYDSRGNPTVEVDVTTQQVKEKFPIFPITKNEKYKIKKRDNFGLRFHPVPRLESTKRLNYVIKQKHGWEKVLCKLSKM
jgi:enolase